MFFFTKVSLFPTPDNTDVSTALENLHPYYEWSFFSTVQNDLASGKISVSIVEKSLIKGLGQNLDLQEYKEAVSIMTKLSGSEDVFTMLTPEERDAGIATVTKVYKQLPLIGTDKDFGNQIFKADDMLVDRALETSMKLEALHSAKPATWGDFLLDTFLPITLSIGSVILLSYGTYKMYKYYFPTAENNVQLESIIKSNHSFTESPGRPRAYFIEEQIYSEKPISGLSELLNYLSNLSFYEQLLLGYTLFFLIFSLLSFFLGKWLLYKYRLKLAKSILSHRSIS